MDDIIHNSIQVIGKVQGVFFRANARKMALSLGINGWVRNEPDGTLRIEAEGTEEELVQFLSWCNEGPEHAQVERVIYEPGELMGYERFEVR